MIGAHTQHGYETVVGPSRSAEWWEGVRNREKEFSEMDRRMELIYEMKNNYESSLYWCREQYGELKAAADPQQQ